jgi:predicted PhzF superfamily epimerase YddE/YHI9
MGTGVLRYAAFTDDGASVDPAGVVLDATGLARSKMLAIAQDVGYSERDGPGPFITALHSQLFGGA